jgi:hypothetical protein
VTPRPEWTFFGVPIADAGGTRVVNLTVHTERDASRTGSYLSDLGKLTAGDLRPAEFESRWRGESIGGVRFESRPDYAVEAARRAGPPPGGERYRRSVPRGPR